MAPLPRALPAQWPFRVQDAESANDTPEGMVKAGLYLQGLGGTVVAALVEEDVCRDQAFLASLAGASEYAIREYETR